jgi:hypothetical protein
VAGYGGALLAKEMAISFPAVVLWLSGVTGRLHRSARLLLPLVGVSGIYLAAWLLLFPYKLAQGNLIAHLLQVPFEYHLRSVFRLLALAFLPVYYPSHDTTYLDEESTLYLLGGAALFLGAGALVFKWGRRAEKLLFLFGAGFLVLTVVPLYNFRHPDFIRLGYIPALGATLAAAGLLAFVSRRPAGPFLAAAVLMASLGRSLPVVQEILAYWGPGGGIVEVVNRDRVADSDWLGRIGPERRAVFEAQVAAEKGRQQHVPGLLSDPDSRLALPDR